MHMWDIYVGRQMQQAKKNIFEPDPVEDLTRDSPHVKQTLSRRYTSRLVPQVSTSVLYIYTN